MDYENKVQKALELARKLEDSPEEEKLRSEFLAIVGAVLGIVERGRDATSIQEKALNSNADVLKDSYKMKNYKSMVHAVKMLGEMIKTNKILWEKAQARLVK